MVGDDQISRICASNDLLREYGIGGKLVVSAGVAALTGLELAAAIAGVRSFNNFTPDNDPYGEHDCAVMVVSNQRFIWKIDYYDQSFTSSSPDPSDPAVTARVLTVMLAAEY